MVDSGYLISSLFEIALLLYVGRALLADWRYLPAERLHGWLFVLQVAALGSILFSAWFTPVSLPIWPQTILLDPITQEPLPVHSDPLWQAVMDLFLKVYLAGVVALLLLWAWCIAELSWMNLVAQPVPDRRWRQTLKTLSSRRVRLVLSPKLCSPVTWGLWRPVIAIPPQALSWRQEEIRWALLHELAHIDRGDWFSQQLSRLACVFCWPLSVSWQLFADLCLEAERAADTRVVNTGVAAADYASWLLGQARDMRAAPGVALARDSSLQERLRYLLDRPVGAASVRFSLLPWLLLGFVVAVPLAQVQFTTLYLSTKPISARSVQLRSLPAEPVREAPGARLIERFGRIADAPDILRPPPPPTVSREPRYPPSTAPP